jgi:hypothetical protein
LAKARGQFVGESCGTSLRVCDEDGRPPLTISGQQRVFICEVYAVVVGIGEPSLLLVGEVDADKAPGISLQLPVGGLPAYDMTRTGEFRRHSRRVIMCRKAFGGERFRERVEQVAELGLAAAIMTDDPASRERARKRRRTVYERIRRIRES